MHVYSLNCHLVVFLLMQSLSLLCINMIYKTADMPSFTYALLLLSTSWMLMNKRISLSHK